MKTKTKKKSPISLLTTFFILLAIPLTVLLIQQTNIFRPKAADYNNRFLSYPGRQTPTPVPFICTACKADLTKDGYVNGADTSKFSSCFGKKASDLNAAGVACTYADLNGDGNVNETDQSCIQGQFLQTCIATPSVTPIVNSSCTACAADLNKDGVVNGGDASALSSCWGKTTSERGTNGVVCAMYDIDKNGRINEGDLSCVSAQMLKSCSR